MSIHITLDKDWIKPKSKKDLTQGMVLRVPWPDVALDDISRIGYKELKINRMAANGNPVIETPSGGELEVDNIKDIYWKKGTDPDGDKERAEVLSFVGRLKR